jgi:hypothetical protein
MSVILEKDNFTFTDSLGKTKFSLNRRMPHILYNLPGITAIPTILGANPSASSVQRTDEIILINNNLINTNDYFILPFVSINGGYADSGNSIVNAVGTTLLRTIKQPSSGTYLGSSLMTFVAEPGSLKIVCKHSFDRKGFTNIVGDDPINVSYRVYYGRFL